MWPCALASWPRILASCRAKLVCRVRRCRVLCKRYAVTWNGGEVSPGAWSSPTATLAVLFLIGNIGWSMSAACSRSPGPGFLLLYWLAVQWAFAWWVLVDCRRRGIATSVDHGWFVSLAWPVA